MKIIGLTRIKNEEEIIKDTLDHLSEFCNEIIVYDDLSTDRTKEIVKAHPGVTKLIEGTIKNQCRDAGETIERQIILEEALKNAAPEDWIVYIDADERIEFNWDRLKDNHLNVVRMKLFDFYITPEDERLSYHHRKWCGPEYRIITFAVRVKVLLGFRGLCCREMQHKGKPVVEGFVKHYGKSISVAQWEETCNFYTTEHFSAMGGMYKPKWEARKGKAIHTTHSDFGMLLIQWHEKEDKGVLMDTVTKGKPK